MTIAGITRLTETEQINPKVIEAIISVVAMLAYSERGLTPDPAKATEEQMRLDMFTSRWWSTSTLAKNNSLFHGVGDWFQL